MTKQISLIEELAALEPTELSARFAQGKVSPADFGAAFALQLKLAEDRGKEAGKAEAATRATGLKIDKNGRLQIRPGVGAEWSGTVAQAAILLAHREKLESIIKQAAASPHETAAQTKTRKDKDGIETSDNYTEYRASRVDIGGERHKVLIGYSKAAVTYVVEQGKALQGSKSS